MGIDMMVMVEVRHRGGEWHPLKDMPLAYKVPRNNVMFSMLADVGNRTGRIEPRWQEPRKMQTDTGETVDVPGWWYDPDDGGHERLEPVEPPRGIPDDASLQWQANVAIWESQREAVITTYLTPAEIMTGNWDQRITRTGIISEEDYVAYREKGIAPELWAGAAGGPGCRTVTSDEYDAGERGESTTAVQFTWDAGTAREICKDFLAMVEDLALVNDLGTGSELRFMLLFEY